MSTVPLGILMPAPPLWAMVLLVMLPTNGVLTTMLMPCAVLPDAPPAAVSPMMLSEMENDGTLPVMDTPIRLLVSRLLFTVWLPPDVSAIPAPAAEAPKSRMCSPLTVTPPADTVRPLAEELAELPSMMTVPLG